MNPMFDPNVCSFTGCGNRPVMQYRQHGPDSSTMAFFACTTHEYTDTNQMTGIHQLTCTRFPCNCTPDQDPVGINA